MNWNIAFTCVYRTLHKCYQTMEGNAGVEVRVQVSGGRCQVLGGVNYELLIINCKLKIEKIFIRKLSVDLEH